jgi:TetR/AcrR family transcriptional repressor of nem operon
MRYPPDHKERTRQKVLDLAAADLCVNGIERTGIAEIMRSAGLTHGGFYAHFASKDEMVAAAITQMFGRLNEKLETGMRHHGPARTLDLFINSYLSTKHRDSPARGCPIAALAGEVQRQPASTKLAYSAGLERYLRTIAALLPLDKGKGQTDFAASLLMEMVGALLLARCVADNQASERVLEGAKHSVEMRFGEPQPGRPAHA